MLHSTTETPTPKGFILKQYVEIMLFFSEVLCKESYGIIVPKYFGVCYARMTEIFAFTDYLDPGSQNLVN